MMGGRGANLKADDASITHVSDTALWVATFRAREGHRADAAFDDPLASILSGERGPRIARSFTRTATVAWSVIVRTSAIDRLIYDALAAGIDTVLNLGAGLDCRPYRMKLPQSLRWVEIDFQTIVDMKNAQLIQYQPACRLERIGMDLLDRASRREIFARYGAASTNMLVITEGVIPYFAAHEIAALAEELHAIASLRCWIQDFENAGKRGLPRGWAKKLQAAPMLFEVKDWFEFFAKFGWRSSKVITSIEEAERIARPYPMDFPYGLVLRAIPKEMSRRILALSGAVSMQK
jgi:methyltransferase (TIGR00027 family)